MKFHQPLDRPWGRWVRFVLLFKSPKISIDWGSGDMGAYCIYKVHRGVIYVINHGVFEDLSSKDLPE